MSTRRALLVATVSRSLLRQSPVMWDVLEDAGYALTFAAARDECSETLARRGSFVEVSLGRRVRDLPTASTAVALRDLRRLLHEPWDLVQVQSPIAGALVRLLAPPRRSYPLIYVAHGFHFHTPKVSKADPAYRALESVLAGRADALVLVNGDDFGHALEHWHRRTSVFRVPGGGVPVDGLVGLTPTRGSNLCLFVGDLNANKDVWFAVDVVAALRAREVPVRLRIFGTGPFERGPRTFAAANPWCEVAGVTNSVAEIYDGAAVLLAPSKREGLPRVIVEALAAGVPVIARDNRGSREALRGGIGHVLSGDATPESWAAVVTDLLQRTPDGPDISAGRARAAEYDEQSVRRAYEVALSELGLRPGVPAYLAEAG